MADFVFTEAKRALLAGELDLNAHDIRVALCMTNTNADTEEDANFLGDLTLDEVDGANYVRKALNGEAVNEDTGNDRADFDADDVTWTALGAGTRNVAGALVFRHVTNDADSVPIAWIDSGGFPFTLSGGNLTITWNASGILRLS